MPRLRKSTQQHLLQGTEPQHKKGSMEDSVGSFVAGRPKMPHDFSPEEEREWKRVVKELWKRGTVTRIDGSALEVYVRTWGRWRVLIDSTNEKEVKLAAQLGNTLRIIRRNFLPHQPAAKMRGPPHRLRQKKNQN